MQRLRALRGEGGFTLPEAMVALTIMAIAIVMTIAPVMAAMSGLQRAKVVSIASNLAQARVEEVRSLPYLDVGFPSSYPAGVLTPTESVTVQGVDFDVVTEVEYVGSVTGLNIMPGGGDGAPTSPDTGIDYKRVTVRIVHSTGLVDDVVMDTIVAPPYLGAHEAKANVVVNLVRHNPFGVNDPAVNPNVCLTRDTLPDIVSSTTTDTQTFSVIDPNSPTAPNYWYYVRLSPAPGCDTHGGFPDEWWIHPDDLANQSERVHVPATQTATATITIYRAVTVEVRIEEDVGDPTDASAYLYMEHDQGITFFDEGGQVSDGVWKVTTIGGAPIVPGLFTFSVTANGFIPAIRSSVQVPSGFPSDLDHVETFVLQVASMDTDGVEVQVKDEYGEVIHGAIVTFSEPALWPDLLALPTDAQGKVYAYIPKTTIDELTVNSPYGHESYGPVSFDPTDSTVDLATPSGLGGIRFEKSGNGDFGFRDSASPDDFSVVLANDSAKASAAVAPGTYEVVKLCDDGSTAATGSVTITAGNSQIWGGSEAECP